MATIVGNKIGKIINLLIDGNVFQKKCDTPEQADAFFKLVVAAKKGGPDDYKKLMMELNRLHRIIVNGILETDQTGQFYLKGFNHPIPELLLNTINEYIDNDYPINAITNFWKLLMLNKDTKVRDGLFKFLSQYQFAITDNGYFTAYKVVQTYSKGISDDAMISFVKEKFEKLKSWKKSPKNYAVMYNENEKKYITVVNGDQDLHDNFKVVGNLDHLHIQIQTNTSDIVYTDRFNQTTRIVLGKPVSKERKFEPHEVECSGNGLHAGSTPYINHFYSKGNTVLTVLINPAHVIHIPDSESTKLRTAEYYPFAILEHNDDPSENGKFKVLKQPYFETDYANYERDKIESDLELIRQDEANSVVKTDKQLDYKKLLEQRLVDLNQILNAPDINLQKQS